MSPITLATLLLATTIGPTKGGGPQSDAFWDLTPPQAPPFECPLAAPPVELSEWSSSPVWDDGKAEVATYTARKSAAHDFEATMITVKETFETDQAVKANPPYDDREVVDVLKVNWLQELSLGATPMQWLTSVFVRRDNPFQLLKSTHSSQAWDGNYFRKLVVGDGEVKDEWHSFMDGEAQGEDSHPQEPFVTPEQLVLALRSIKPAEDLNFHVRLSRPLRNARYNEFDISDAEVDFKAVESFEGPEGPSKAWLVTVKGDDFKWRYWYEDSPNRPLLRLEGPDLRLDLKSIERRAYWVPESDP